MLLLRTTTRHGTRPYFPLLLRNCRDRRSRFRVGIIVHTRTLWWLSLRWGAFTFDHRAFLRLSCALLTLSVTVARILRCIINLLRDCWLYFPSPEGIVRPLQGWYYHTVIFVPSSCIFHRLSSLCIARLARFIHPCTWLKWVSSYVWYTVRGGEWLIAHFSRTLHRELHQFTVEGRSARLRGLGGYGLTFYVVGCPSSSRNLSKLSDLNVYISHACFCFGFWQFGLLVSRPAAVLLPHGKQGCQRSVTPLMCGEHFALVPATA